MQLAKYPYNAKNNQLLPIFLNSQIKIIIV